MKTFTANEFRRAPRQVYRAADVEGSVKINHSDYPDKVFIIEGRERRAEPFERVPAVENKND